MTPSEPAERFSRILQVIAESLRTTCRNSTENRVETKVVDGVDVSRTLSEVHLVAPERKPLAEAKSVKFAQVEGTGAVSPVSFAFEVSEHD